MAMRGFARGRLLVALFMVAALVSAIGIAAARPAASQEAAEAAVKPHKTIDDLLMDVNAIVPGFGGVFLDDGVPTIYLKAPSRKGTAEAAVREVFDPRLIPPGEFQVLQGQYSVEELNEWRDRLLHSWETIPMMMSLDLNEGANRVSVGIRDIGQRDDAEVRLAALGIPKEAVTIHKETPVTLESHTLESEFEDEGIEAGIRVTAVNDTWVQACTLGFIALRDNDLGLVTVSHCTEEVGVVGGDELHQPTSFDALIGTEITDPAKFSSTEDSNCPTTDYECRYSDAAFFDASSWITFNRGEIARPDPDDHTAPIDVEHSPTLFFEIVAEITSGGVQGATIHKVGRTTGWTTGEIGTTCVTRFPQTDFTALCQNLADYDSEVGDSGSPIFMIDSEEENEVWLLGIHSGSGGGQVWYSPLGAIYDELGPSANWNACIPAAIC